MKIIQLADSDFILVRHWFRWYKAYPPYDTWQKILPLKNPPQKIKKHNVKGLSEAHTLGTKEE